MVTQLQQLASTIGQHLSTTLRQHTQARRVVLAAIAVLALISLTSLLCILHDNSRAGDAPARSASAQVADAPTEGSDAPVPSLPFQHLCHHTLREIGLPLRPVPLTVVIIVLALQVGFSTRVPQASIRPLVPPPQLSRS